MESWLPSTSTLYEIAKQVNKVVYSLALLASINYYSMFRHYVSILETLHMCKRPRKLSWLMI